MVPTRRFWWIVAAGIPICAIAAAAGNPSFFWLYNGLIFGLAYLSSLVPGSRLALRVERRFDSVLSVRVSNKIQLTIFNDGLTSISGVLRDEPPQIWECVGNEFRFQIDPGREIIRSYFVTPPSRGTEWFIATFLLLDCPLGLAYRKVRLETRERIRIYPNVLALQEFDMLRQQGRLREIGIRKSRQRGLGTEFESLRDYSEGDDFRKIDWKATSRRGKLVVRQYEQERNQVVMLIIDVGRYMLAEVDGVRKLDHVLDSALMLAHSAARAGDQVGLLVYGETVLRYIPPGKGKNRLGMVLEAIHDLVAEPVEPDPVSAASYLGSRWKRRSLMVLFTDAEDEDYARELARAWGSEARKHLFAMARVSDPQLKEAANLVPTVPEDLYARSAGQILLTDRRKATQILSAARIQSVEAEPNELTSALVNFYLMVKERSLL